MKIEKQNFIKFFSLYIFLILYKFFFANDYINNDGLLYIYFAKNLFSPSLYAEINNIPISYLIFSFFLRIIHVLGLDYLYVTRLFNLAIYSLFFFFSFKILNLKSKKDFFIFLLVFLSLEKLFSSYLLMTIRDSFFWSFIFIGTYFNFCTKNKNMVILTYFFSGFFRIEGFVFSLYFLIKFTKKNTQYLKYLFLFFIFLPFIFYLSNYPISNNFSISKIADDFLKIIFKCLQLLNIPNTIILFSILLNKKVFSKYLDNFILAFITIMIVLLHGTLGNDIVSRYLIPFILLLIFPIYEQSKFLLNELEFKGKKIIKFLLLTLFLVAILINFRHFNYTDKRSKNYLKPYVYSILNNEQYSSNLFFSNNYSILSLSDKIQLSKINTNSLSKNAKNKNFVIIYFYRQNSELDKAIFKINDHPDFYVTDIVDGISYHVNNFKLIVVENIKSKNE
jgi:hypothetical protein